MTLRFSTPRKRNVVVDTLSRRYTTLNDMNEWRQLEFLSQFNIQLPTFEAQEFLAVMEVRSVLMDRIMQRQKVVEMLLDIFGKLERSEQFPLDGRYSNVGRKWLGRDEHLYVSILEDILEEVLAKSHCSRMAIHPGGDKMFISSQPFPSNI